ncbi:MAG: LuxR C-terminal-related transcriptional regulator [Pseudomonadota bacterium]
MTAKPTCEELSKRVFELEHGILQSTDAYDSLAWERLLSEHVLDRLPAGLAYFSEDFVLLKCNRAYADFLTIHAPYDREQALGMCYFDYKPGIEPYIVDWLRHVRDSGLSDTRYDMELSWMGRDGKEHESYWDVHLSPVLGLNKTEGLLMCCIDTTENHSIKSALGERDQGMAVEFRHIDELKKALRTILGLREEDKTLTQDKLVSNVRKMVVPWIEKLKQSPMNVEQQTYLKIIESNLTKLTSPFCQRLSSANQSLTPMEIQVANLVEQGNTSKEIAELLRVSKECVDFHRNNIRKKLGLTGKKANLKTYLTAIGR